MRNEPELPRIRIGVRTMRPFGFNQFRTMILRSVTNAVDAEVEVVAYPDACDIALVEQGTVYDSAPSALVIRLSHQEVRDPYQVSMRVRRELKSYLFERE